MAEQLSREMDQHTKTMALIKLASLRRQHPDDHQVMCLAGYVQALEQSLTRFSATHMAEVWRENERLKAALAALEQQGEAQHTNAQETE